MKTSISHCLCHINIAKSGHWLNYHVTNILGDDGYTGPERETETRYVFGFKEFRVQIEIISAIFDWISKHHITLSLFLSD